MTKVPLTSCPFLFNPPAKLLENFIDSLRKARSTQQASLWMPRPEDTKCQPQSLTNGVVGRYGMESTIAYHQKEVSGKALNLKVIFGRNKAAKNDNAGINYDY